MSSTRHLAPIVCVLAMAATAAARPASRHGDQVVALTVTWQTHDEYRPWSKTKPQTRTGFAAVIDGPYLLVEAELVEDATLVQVEKNGSPPKVAARVVHMDRHVNLALLAVDEPGFFDDLQPARLARSAPTRGELTTVRWRKGQLEAGATRFSRMEVFHVRAYEAQVALLVVNTDLTGPGAGEPVFAGRELVGLTEWGKDDVAHVIPPEVIRAYLGDALSGELYRGFPNLGLYWQENRDRALAAWLGLQGEPRGVIVRQVHHGGSAWGVIEPRDVLLSIDDQAIDADGYVQHEHYGRLKYQHLLIERYRAGDTVAVQVLRGGELLGLQLALRTYTADEALVPWRRSDTPPPYLVAGGLVFRTLDLNYLHAWGDWKAKAPVRLLTAWDLQRHGQTEQRTGIVVLAYVLPDPYNQGYHALSHVAVEQVNGHPISSITDLHAALQAPVDGFHVITLQPNSLRREVVLDAATLDAATAEILTTYNIPAAQRLP
jgi:S1-C subfamily serine protease